MKVRKGVHPDDTREPDKNRERRAETERNGGQRDWRVETDVGGY